MAFKFCEYFFTEYLIRNHYNIFRRCTIIPSRLDSIFHLISGGVQSFVLSIKKKPGKYVE